MATYNELVAALNSGKQGVTTQYSDTVVPKAVQKFAGNDLITRELYGRLFDSIKQGGRFNTDITNRRINSVLRGQEAAQLGIQDSMARKGLTGSGLAEALKAASAQGGQILKQQVLADEAERASQERRQNLALYHDLVLQPSQWAYELELAEQERRRQEKKARRNRRLKLATAVVGAVATIATGGAAAPYVMGAMAAQE